MHIANTEKQQLVFVFYAEFIFVLFFSYNYQNIFTVWPLKYQRSKIYKNGPRGIFLINFIINKSLY